LRRADFKWLLAWGVFMLFAGGILMRSDELGTRVSAAFQFVLGVCVLVWLYRHRREFAKPPGQGD
jgi:hypothetical protein